MKKSPVLILKETFGLNPASGPAKQGIASFKKECDALKSHDNYVEFIHECAAFIGAEVDEEKLAVAAS